MARNYAAFPHEYLEEMEELSDAEFGRLARALLKFSMTGEPIALCGNERFYTKRVMNRELRYIQEYENMLERNRENGKKGGRPKNPTVLDETQENPSDFPENPLVFSETQKSQSETKTETETKTEISNILLPGAETPPAPPASPAVISILLNDKTEYQVTEADVAGWRELYPAVNVMQELRKMKGWADANPAKRKTRSGIKRFINSWLAKEQDRYHAPTSGGQSHGAGGKTSNPFLELLNERRAANDDNG